MTHPRKIIRQSVADGVKALNTAAADRVWAAFEPPVNVERVLMDEGPVILIYTRRDRSAEDDFSPTGTEWVKRRCDLCIEILAAGAFVVDDALDDMAEAVEAFVDGFEVPGMPSAEIRLAETNIETSDRFAQPVGGAFLLYDACYYKAWRVEPEDEPFFPTEVFARIRGDAGELVADCSECDECPEGARP